MEAKELRIGNFIEDIHYPELILFTEVDLELFAGLYDGTILESDLQPIPLTEKWLLDFGFQKNAFSFKKKLDDSTHFEVSICNDKGLGEYYGVLRQENDILIIPQRTFYLHQLQNLYFALTGQELQLKQQTT